MSVSTPNISDERKEQIKSAGKFAGMTALYAISGWAEANSDSTGDDEPQTGECERCGHETMTDAPSDLENTVLVCYECKIEMGKFELEHVQSQYDTVCTVPRAE